MNLDGPSELCQLPPKAGGIFACALSCAASITATPHPPGTPWPSCWASSPWPALQAQGDAACMTHLKPVAAATTSVCVCTEHVGAGPAKGGRGSGQSRHGCEGATDGNNQRGHHCRCACASWFMNCKHSMLMIAPAPAHRHRPSRACAASYRCRQSVNSCRTWQQGHQHLQWWSCRTSGSCRDAAGKGRCSRRCPSTRRTGALGTATLCKSRREGLQAR